MKIKSTLITLVALAAGIGTASAVVIVPRGGCTLTITNHTQYSFSSNFAANQMIGPKHTSLIDPTLLRVPCNFTPPLIPGVSTSIVYSPVTPHYFPQDVGNVNLILTQVSPLPFVAPVPRRVGFGTQYGLDPLRCVFTHIAGRFSLCVPVR